MAKACERCGRGMEDGSLAFEVRIDVYADFDGVLVPPEPGRKTDDELRRLVARMAGAGPRSGAAAPAAGAAPGTRET